MAVSSTVHTENACEGESGKELVARGIGDGDNEERGASDKEERSLFSVDEADAFTAYFVESQQACSLLNVADIQHGKLKTG